MYCVPLSPYSRLYARPEPIAVPCRIGDMETGLWVGICVSFCPHDWPDALGRPVFLGG